MFSNCRLVLAALLLVAIACAAADSAPSLRNGVYAVLKEAPTAEQARVQSVKHAVLLYDRKYSESDRNQPAKYVALDTASFVPLVLAAPPEARTDDRGFTLLSVRLAREHVKTLETFTREHLNGAVAIVLGGEIITMHKVRSVITDGDVKITRCQDNACQVLRTKLTGGL